MCEASYQEAAPPATSDSPGTITRKAIKVGNYVLLRTLGKGSSSEVKLAQNTLTGTFCAVKVMRKDWIRANSMAAAVTREINLMASLKHRNVVELKEVMNSNANVFLVLEFVDGRELYDEIVDK
eukprot:13925-Heterococcus_DN1.PRE.1